MSTLSHLTIPVKNTSTGEVTNQTFDLPTGGGSSSGPKIFYGTCDTAADTAAKVVTCSDFTSADLVVGNIILVKFDHSTTVNCTMNVNSTGAKTVVTRGTNTGISLMPWNDGGIAIFTYDGTNWVLSAAAVCTGTSSRWGMVRTSTIGEAGTASTSAISCQYINPNQIGEVAINRTKYMQGTLTLSTSAQTSITFSHSDITTDSIIEPFTSDWTIQPSNITTSNGSCTLTFDKVSTSKSITVRIYIS